MTEVEGLTRREGASGKLIDQRRGNVRRQVRDRVFMQASRLLKLHLTAITVNKNALCACRATKTLRANQAIKSMRVFKYVSLIRMFFFILGETGFLDSRCNLE